MRALQHLTINAGHNRTSPRDEVADSVVELLRPIIIAGGGAIAGTDFSLKLTNGQHSTIFTINYNDVPIVTCGLASTREGISEVWPAMVRLVESLRDMIVRKTGWSPNQVKRLLPLPSAEPQAPPLLAVLLFPHAGLMAGPSVLAMAADLERCVAWTILDHEASTHVSMASSE